SHPPHHSRSRASARAPNHIVDAIAVNVRPVRERGHFPENLARDLMRQSLAGISNCPAALSVALLAAVMAPASPDVALSDASGSGTLTSTAPPAPACGSNELELHEPSPDSEPGCATAPRTPEEIAEARAYLIVTP